MTFANVFHCLDVFFKFQESAHLLHTDKSLPSFYKQHAYPMQLSTQ